MPGGPACTGCRTRGTSSASDRSRRRECLPARPPGDALGQVGHVTRGGALSRHSGHVARELNGGIFICVGTHPVRVPIARHEHRLIPLDQQPERDAGRSRAPREGTGPGDSSTGYGYPRPGGAVGRPGCWVTRHAQGARALIAANPVIDRHPSWVTRGLVDELEIVVVDQSLDVLDPSFQSR